MSFQNRFFQLIANSKVICWKVLKATRFLVEREKKKEKQKELSLPAPRAVTEAINTSHGWVAPGDGRPLELAACWSVLRSHSALVGMAGHGREYRGRGGVEPQSTPAISKCDEFAIIFIWMTIFLTAIILRLSSFLGERSWMEVGDTRYNEMLLHHTVDGDGSLRKRFQILGAVISCKDLRCGQLLGWSRGWLGDPGVLQDFICAVALAWVAHQQVADQVLCRVAHSLPFILGKVVHAILDWGEEQFLAVLTCLTTLPAAIFPALAIKRRVATQRDV